MNRSALLRAAVAAAALPLVPAGPAAASPEADVRATFDAFVKAQNDHSRSDLTALLWNSDQSLWITRNTAIWGRDNALARFATYWDGTWKLAPPAPGDVHVALQSADSAFVHAAVVYTIGPKDGPSSTVPFLLTLGMMRTGDRWVVTSIVPVPPPPKPCP